MTTPLLQVTDLKRHYRQRRQSLFVPPRITRALDGVTLSLQAGQSLGIVGESGSGKSTLARLVMALDQPTSGTVEILGRKVHALPPRELQQARRDFQMVFQDPYASLDPRQDIERIVTEPLHTSGAGTEALRAQAIDALHAVGLQEADLDKYPHEFSGGQRQRIAIARALISSPKLIVADEPVSALDVSVQAQVLNLIRRLQTEHGISFILISHDLAVVHHVCDQIAVLYHGKVVEYAPTEQLFAEPQHPYTRQLLAAAPLL